MQKLLPHKLLQASESQPDWMPEPHPGMHLTRLISEAVSIGNKSLQTRALPPDESWQLHPEVSSFSTFTAATQAHVKGGRIFGPTWPAACLSTLPEQAHGAVQALLAALGPVQGQRWLRNRLLPPAGLRSSHLLMLLINCCSGSAGTNWECEADARQTLTCSGCVPPLTV